MKYYLPRISITFLKKVSVSITQSFTNEYFNFSVSQLIVLVLLPAVVLFLFTLN